MKIRIEVSEDVTEDEIIIRCKKVTPTIQKIYQDISEQTSMTSIVFYKDNQEVYSSLDSVYFFETSGENVYAHTANDVYRIKYRLYELEKMLPRHFIRIAKSTILNTHYVYSIQRNLTSSSLIQFQNSHKQVYVSRLYYKSLKQRLDERSHYEK